MTFFARVWNCYAHHSIRLFTKKNHIILMWPVAKYRAGHWARHKALYSTMYSMAIGRTRLITLPLSDGWRADYVARFGGRQMTHNDGAFPIPVENIPNFRISARFNVSKQKTRPISNRLSLNRRGMYGNVNECFQTR